MANLLMTVEDMQDREKWLKAREAGIGGSDAAAIVGLTPWKSAFQLWLEKTGQAEPEDLSDNERVYWGTQLEEVVAREFTRRTGKAVRRRGLLQSEEYPFLLASVDRMVIGEDAGLECKTANGFAAKAWENDEVPDAYYCQCQHYMMVTGCQRWYIAVLIGGNKFVWKAIDRNEADIKALQEAEIAFWDKVQKKEMPPVDGSGSCTEALANMYRGGKEEAIQLPSQAADVIQEIDTLTETEKGIKATLDEKKNVLRSLLGDFEVGYAGQGDNVRKVTWKTQEGRTTIDSKRLKAEQPAVYEKYAKQGKETRVLRIA